MGIEATQEAYASHLPILRELGSGHGIERVIEFGVGPFSTPVFLDSNIYTELTHLLSFENDPIWAMWAHNHHGDDKRFSLIEADEYSQFQITPYSHYDMAFVDSYTYGMRMVSIAKIRLRCRLIVLHDAEQACYSKVLKSFKHLRLHKPTDGTPWTAIMSNFEEVG